MEWSDDAIVLTSRRHGETSAVVTLLTPGHGRHAGLVRGGTSPSGRGVLATGSRVRARWRGRLEDHLGVLVCEPVESVAARLFTDGARLAALAAACALVEASVPERAPSGGVYGALSSLLDTLGGEVDWPAAYVRWELTMLTELGFALDLGRCAATGRNDQLAYVSPKSGRAVSLSAGAPYRDRLLPLPPFLVDGGRVQSSTDIAAGLHLTGFFLARCAFPPPAELPPARARLVELLTRRAVTGPDVNRPPQGNGP